MIGTVTTLQMTKLAIIPCTVLLETLFFGKRFRYVTLGLLRPCPLDEYLFISIYYSDLFSPKSVSCEELLCMSGRGLQEAHFGQDASMDSLVKKGRETFWYQIFIFAKVCVEVCILVKTFLGLLYNTI